MSAPPAPRAVTPAHRLEAVAAELDRAFYRGEPLRGKPLHELAEAVRRVQAEIS